MNTQDYPPGADNDNAPWNTPDPVDCPKCGGRGKIPSYFCIDCEKVNHEDPDYCPHCKGDDTEKFEEKYCDYCGGNGTV